MRALAITFALLILALQYPLWLGKGGWIRVWELDRRIDLQHRQNNSLQARNQSLEVEVMDLKRGMEAVEERARYELGMVKPDEVFFQIVEPQRGAAGR